MSTQIITVLAADTAAKAKTARLSRSRKTTRQPRLTCSAEEMRRGDALRTR